MEHSAFPQGPALSPLSWLNRETERESERARLDLNTESPWHLGRSKKDKRTGRSSFSKTMLIVSKPIVRSKPCVLCFSPPQTSNLWIFIFASN